MSRSGYSDEIDNWDLICWRGAVNSAIKGKRGQALLQEMAAALDAMPVKRLIAKEFINCNGDVCALGAVARARSIDVYDLDPENREGVARAFNIAEALAAEIFFINDSEFGYSNKGPEQRWRGVRKWVGENLISEARKKPGRLLIGDINMCNKCFQITHENYLKLMMEVCKEHDKLLRKLSNYK